MKSKLSLQLCMPNKSVFLIVPIVYQKAKHNYEFADLFTALQRYMKKD